MDLSLREMVLVILGESGAGRFRGRTLLQKRAYFLSVLMDRDLGFRPHYYGPYSSSVNSAREELCTLGLVEEHVVGFGATGSRGFEIKRYEYGVTGDGREVLDWLTRRKRDDHQKVSDLLTRMKEADEPDYMTLSVAAKAYLIVNSKAAPLTADEIRREAGNFDWKIKERALNEGIEYLEKLNLVTRTEPSS